MPENMGVNTLKNNLTNPQRTFLWDVIIPSPIGGGDSDTLNVRAQSAVIPGRSVGVIPVAYKQSAGLRFPGKITYTHAWECTFIEGEDRAIHSAVYAWLQAIINDYENIGNGDDAVKQDIYLNMASVDGNTITQKIRLIGCFISAIGDVNVDYETEGIVRYPVTFTFDRWEIVA